ncbi:MAG: hypothetical protein AB1791_12670 [Chloroflexota bacterium]
MARRHGLFILIVVIFLVAACAPAAPGRHLPITHYPLPATICTPNVVNYDVVYVRAPRYGDETNTIWPDTVRPLVPDPGADLRLLHPDCTEELLFPLPEHAPLVDAPLGNGSVSDPNISFDGRWVVFTYYHDQANVNEQRCAGSAYDGCLSRLGADLYRLNLQSRQVARLTAQEFTPNTGNGADFDCEQPYTNCPQVGVFNVGPAFVATSAAVNYQSYARPAIVFTSTRNNFSPPQAFNSAERVLQLFIMDWNGQNVQQIGYLNNSQALHPFQLADGRLMFTSWEGQGMRDLRQFNLWFIAPDGTGWASGSGLGERAMGHHFMTQMPDEDIVVVRYYNLNNNGFGDLVRYPLDPSGPDFGTIDDPNAYMPLQRPGQVDLTRWSLFDWEMSHDGPAPCTVNDPIYPAVPCENGNAGRVGKVTLPAAAPGGDLLLVYTPGPANHNGVNAPYNIPYYDGGLYLMPAAIATAGSDDPADLVQILNDPAYSEQWPRPVVAYSSLFPGRSQPAAWPEYRNIGSENLEEGTPLGLVGSSSLIWRDTHPRSGPDYAPDPDPFNSSHEFLWAWVAQGADAGLYSDDEIYAIRLLALLPSTDRSYPNSGPGFSNVGSERIRILGEVPVRHEGYYDPYGNTDTSFLVRIPADTPFTFQTLDRNGMVLNMAQTWHQLRPGEARTDCGGCHAHSRTPIDFATTVAGQTGFQPTDLALQTPLLHLTEMDGEPQTTIEPVTQTTLEYWTDVAPILEARCAGCHESDTTDGALNLHADDETVWCPWTNWPGTYYRLVRDDNSGGCPVYGLGTPAGTPSYFLAPQLTRYIRAFQSRESLFIWKVFGERLDGRANDTRDGDIDYDPAADPIHPSLDVTHGLTWDEKLTLARWVDMGAPIELDPYWGWYEDDLRPTLWVSLTPGEACVGAMDSVTIGAYDLESGLAADSLSVVFNVSIGGQPPGTNFAAGLNPPNGGVVNVPLPAAVDLIAQQATLRATIQDNVGHTTEVVRTYNAACPYRPGPPPVPRPR